MIDFEQLGYNEFWKNEFEASCKELLGAKGVLEETAEYKRYVLGRVTSLDRNLPEVTTKDFVQRSELCAAIKKSDDSQIAVGDWVVLEQAKEHEHPIIVSVLCRRSKIARIKNVGRKNQIQNQVLAANVNCVFVCQSLSGKGIDLDLLVRQMVAVRAQNLDCIFIFTKADTVENEFIEAECEKVRQVMPDESIIISSLDDKEDALCAIKKLCSFGKTGFLLGESGVGKSSLINALVQESAQKIAQVRKCDDKGRHTTVARRMLAIPNAGVIIDAPGLKTLQISNTKSTLSRAFPDIAAKARNCRFADCNHDGVPGCAVQDAIAPKRLKAYLKLVKEL